MNQIKFAVSIDQPTKSQLLVTLINSYRGKQIRVFSYNQSKYCTVLDIDSVQIIPYHPVPGMYQYNEHCTAIILCIVDWDEQQDAVTDC